MAFVSKVVHFWRNPRKYLVPKTIAQITLNPKNSQKQFELDNTKRNDFLEDYDFALTLTV